MSATQILTLSDEAALAAASAPAALALASGPLAGPESGIVPTMVRAAAGAQIDVFPLRRGISVLDGAGGNIAVLTGPDGKLLVDAGLMVSRSRITEALASLSADPVRHLVNTHWHIDHTDGNAWLHAAGAVITAHTNTRRRLLGATRVEGWQYTFPPALAAGVPAEVFGTDHRLDVNGTTILLKHDGPAHTDSDVSVHFVDADILHVGDKWWNGFYPFIDYSTGGSIDGMIRATHQSLAAASDKTLIIPGHGPVGSRSDLAEYLDMLVTIRDKVAALKRQGRSLDETVAAGPSAAFDDKWGRFLMTPAIFTGLVYAGV